MTDSASQEAMHRLEQRLRRMGVFSALQRAGVQEGNTVRIGPVEFTWDSSYEPGSQPARRGSTRARR
jgi:Obg family GTPase CgtA-like protein